MTPAPRPWIPWRPSNSIAHLGRSLAEVVGDLFADYTHPEITAALNLMASSDAAIFLVETREMERARTILETRALERGPIETIVLSRVVERQVELVDLQKLNAHLRAPAVLRAITLMPRERIDLGEVILPACADWILVRGDTTATARPMHPAWVRELQAAAKRAAVPFNFRGWGSWIPISDAMPHHKRDGDRVGNVWRGKEGDPEDLPMLCYRVGPKLAGRELDGEVYDERPMSLL